MASELPDVLEKLAMKAERSESEQGSSLSKYFGQVDNGDDIFDTIAKPRKTEEEPKVNFFKSPASTPMKEEKKEPPSFAFVKGEQESEPKIFSYFSQATSSTETNKNTDATEFFDQISQMASKTHEPIEISSTEPLTLRTPSPKVATFTPHSPTPSSRIVHQPTWSKAQESAASWWIPSKKTTLVTYPGLSNSVELTDPIRDLLRHFDGEAAASERQTLTADMVSQDDHGIRQLITANCYRAGANLCGRMLTAYGQGFGKLGQPSKHTPHTLQLWFTRLTLLKRSHLVEMAATEAAPFGDLDSPDLGTVPFGFRLLAAELPAHNNRVNEANAKLCRLLSTVRRIVRQVDQFAVKMSDEERKDALQLWMTRERQVITILVQCALIKKDFHNAVQLLRKGLDSAEQWSHLGRVYLHLGDVDGAQKAFNRAADMRDANDVASLCDAALVAIAQNAFAEAHKYYEQALALQPNNPELVNNTAVCLLYLGRMRDAMLLLEENMGTKPDTMIRDDTLLNVCTLYELESSLTMQRKLGMLRLAAKWKSDNLDVASFKLQTT